MPSQNLIISTDNDDGHGFGGSGFLGISFLVSGLNGGNQFGCAFRWQLTETIPVGSTITAADLILQGRATNSASTHIVDFVAELTSDAAAMTASWVLSRTFSTAYARFTDTAITIDTDQTFSIISPIQEVVDSYGISAGSSMLVFGKYVNTTNVDRQFKSYNSTTTLCPRLNLTWTPPPAGVPLATFWGYQNPRLRM